MKYFCYSIVNSAINNFDSPLYLYNAEILSNTYNKLRANLCDDMSVFYSIKANPSFGICQCFCKLGANCEVCSEAELLLALKVGFLPKQIIFVGPGKKNHELELCVKFGILAIVCESINELYNIQTLAEKHNVTCDILLRINPPFSAKTALLKMGGRATQFGLDLNIWSCNIEKLKKLSRINVAGIHVYNGTRILDESTIIDNTNNILSLADTLTNDWKIDFAYIDIGGGFGVPYFSNEKSLDLLYITKNINKLLYEYKIKHPKTKFILESGRFLTANAGILIGTIIDIKQSHEKKFLITDIGMHCHFASTMLSSPIHRNFFVELITANPKDSYIEQNVMEKYTITGPLCTPGDVIVQDVILPFANIGDLIVVKNVGAYGYSASLGRFLSHGFPAEVLYVNNDFYLLRQRELADNILNQQIVLSEEIINHGVFTKIE